MSRKSNDQNLRIYLTHEPLFIGRNKTSFGKEFFELTFRIGHVETLIYWIHFFRTSFVYFNNEPSFKKLAN